MEDNLLPIFRDMMHQHLHIYGKEHLRDNSNLLKCIIASLRAYDKHFNIPIKNEEEYLKILLELKNFDQLMLHAMHAINNHKNKQFDTNLTFDEKNQIYKNSLDFVEEFVVNGAYEKNYHESDLKKEHLDILEELKSKINTDSELKRILKKLEKLKLNFYIDVGLGKFYPIVADILKDAFNMAYIKTINRVTTEQLVSKFDDVKNEHLNNHSSTERLSEGLYNKIDFFKHVFFNQANSYVPYNHAKKLNLDIKEYSKLYKDVLFYESKNQRHFPSKDLNMEKSNHLFVISLEFTKLVI